VTGRLLFAYLGSLAVITLSAIGALYLVMWDYTVDDMQVSETSLRGMAKTTQQTLAGAEGDVVDDKLQQLSAHFEFDVRLATTAELATAWPATSTERLQKGQFVVFADDLDHGVLVVATDAGVVAVGPFPPYADPSTSTYSWLFALLAVATALTMGLILLPVTRRLRHIEAVAAGIADGDLSRRVEPPFDDVRLAQAFNVMAERTEGTIAQQQELLQAVSHELRTPLQRLRLGLERMGVDDDDAVGRDLEELESLVDELFEYVKAKDGRPLQRSSVDVVEVVSDVVARLSEHADVDVRLNGPDCVVDVDPRGFERVLVNLVGNAVRFAASTVAVTWTVAEGHLVLDVDDDGPGIAPEQRSEVLRPFVQLETTDRGAGLGLALAERIVVAHDGCIDVLDAELGGARLRTTWVGPPPE